MTFFKSSKHQRLLWSLLLLSVGAAAGFGTGDILRCRAARRLPGERPDPGAGRKLRLPCLGVLRRNVPGAGADAREVGLSDLDDGPSKTTPDVCPR